MSGPPQKGEQYIHVRGDSDSDLEALFKAVMNPGQTQHPQQGLPLRQRKLPSSFFNPPKPQQEGQHSRDGSADSSYRSPPPGTPQNPTNLPIAHPRAHSSPATLQQTLRAAPPPPPPQHVRQHSYDALTDEGPLPPGWDVAKTPDGQRYFLNHLEQITTWHDPRKSISTSALNNQASPPPQPHSQQSPSISLQNLGALPAGWEQASTPDGEVYFINHIERTTSWYDPRLPVHMQRPTMRVPQGQGPMLPAIPSQVTGQGQQQGQQRMTQAERQRQLQLRQLQLEKERLRKRQEELARQEHLLRQHIHETPEIPISQSQPTSEMTSPTDPFLSQNTNSDMHARQESADSGLGGMGTSYSLSRTPEDFLGNVDEMDTSDGGHTTKVQGLPEFSSMDIGNIGDGGDNANMDGDDLVPSLQEEISSDLLHDVESVLNTKVDLMTWL